VLISWEQELFFINQYIITLSAGDANRNSVLNLIFFTCVLRTVAKCGTKFVLNGIVFEL
jgi:hypothetical protein